MKRIVSLLLVCVMMLTLFPTFTFAVDEASLIYTTFADYEVCVNETVDTYCNVPIELRTYCAIDATKNTEVALYIKNHSMERIGTEDDISIINDLLKEYIVVVVDYKNAPEAVSPNLEWGINNLIGQLNAGQYMGGLSFRKNYFYQVPEGCRIAKNILYFELDKHAPNGTLNYIIEVWNKYYAGKMKDANGNLLPTATTIEECIKKDGTPIDLDLRLDIIYPSKPKEIVPVFMLAASSETSRKTAITIDRPVYTGMLLNGYAAVCYDHEYIPMSRDDHYGYLNDAFSLYHYTANRSHSAAVRKVRQIAHQYGFNAEYMGNWGFSKSSTGPAWLSDKSHLEKGEVRYWDAKYNPNGESPYESPEPQPWLTYDDGTEISSNVTVTYSGSGPGFHMHAAKTLPKDKANQVPTLNSSGRFDDTGNFFKLYPPVYSAFREYDMESLTLPIDNIAHTYPQGYDATRGTDYYKVYFDFFDNQIRSAYRKEAPVVLWTTPLDKSEVLSTSVPVEVKFSRSMDVESVKEGINVINETTGKKVDGTWNVYNGNTKFEFTAVGLDINTRYKIEVTKECKASDGVNLAENMVKRFKVAGTETISASKDAYIENGANADVNFGSEDVAKVYKSDDINRKSYFGFTRDGGYDDVIKATLVLSSLNTDSINSVYGISDSSWQEDTITWNNAPANNTDGKGFDTEKVYGGKEIGFINDDETKRYVDVTEYVKNASGNDLTFALESSIKNGVTQNYTFEDMTTSDFVAGKNYRLGGGSATVAIVSEDAKNGENCLKISKRQTKNVRIKLYNSFDDVDLTQNHLGAKYHVGAYVKAIEDTTVKLGVMYQSSTVIEYATSKDLKAGEWTYIENEFEVNQDMIDANTQFVSFEPTTEVDTIYLDDIKVTYLGNENEITTKEGVTNTHPLATLVLDTADDISKKIGDTVYIESGDNADKNLASSKTLFVRGKDSVYTSGMQKAYALFPLTDVDTSTNVNLKFDIKAPANQNILVYGLDVEGMNKNLAYSESEATFGSSELWDETITWNSAFANDKEGVGVLKEFSYGNAPIATIDASVSGQKSVDVTNFVKAMKEEGATNATIVFAAEKQGRRATIDFEGDISKYNLVLSHKDNTSYEIVEGGYDGTGHALRFIRTGNEATGGYSQSISINNFVDADGGMWTEDDIGRVVKISWKEKGITSPLQTSGYKHTFVTSVALSGAPTNVDPLGDTSTKAESFGTTLRKINQSANTWGSYSTQFTITKDMFNSDDDYQKTALVFSAYWGSKEIWIDDITVEYVGDSVTIAGGNDEITKTQKKYTFDEENVDLSDFVLRQDSKNPGSTITIAKGEGKDGTNALLFTKTQSFTPSLAIPFVINDNNLLTEDDIGKTYKVSFDAKLTRGFGETTGSNVILAKIGVSDTFPVDFTASTDLTKIGCLGSIADTRVRTEYSLGQWTTITMQFTITSDMVANDADKTYLYMNAFTNIGSIHIDNVISEVTIPAKEGPYLEVVGEETTKNGAIEMNMISSSNPDTYYQRGDTVIKREDFATGAYGASKAYMQYDIVTPHLLKGASLIFNVLNDIKDGQTVDIYGFNNASFNKNTITYNNAPFNDLFTNGVNKDAVYEGGRLARIAVEKGENVIDVTSYAKEVEEGNKVSFAIVTEDIPNQVIYERNFEDGINIAVPRDVRFGGQPSVAYTVNSETGNKYLTFSNIKTTYSRARFKNVFGKPYFTSSDIGTQYKVSLSVRPSADTKFVIGIMSTYPDSSLSKLNDFSGGGLNKIDVAGGVWTDLSFVYKVSNTSVNGQVNSLSMEQLTSGVSFDVDNIKIEKIIGGDAVEIDSNVSMNVAYNEPDLTSNSVVIKEINSTGNFNKGDSVIVNAEIDTAFDKNVENVEFYLDDTLLTTPNIINGNIYTQKLINVQPGTYNIRVEATFDDGETLVAEEMIEISENVSFESIKTTVSKALEGEKGYTLTKSVKSNIAKNTDVIMIVGIYDENDNLLDVIKSPKTIIGGGKYKEITATTKSLKALTEGAYAKVMIWTCDTNLPIMGSETVR